MMNPKQIQKFINDSIQDLARELGRDDIEGLRIYLENDGIARVDDGTQPVGKEAMNLAIDEYLAKRNAK